MEIKETLIEKTLTLEVKGRLDTLTAPELETSLSKYLENIDSLIFDFSNLDYISSAGLRLLLSSQKEMNKRGSMIVKNVSKDIMDVLELTGFKDFLKIE